MTSPSCADVVKLFDVAEGLPEIDSVGYLLSFLGGIIYGIRVV